MTPTSIYARAIARWGTDAQTDMAIEECAELIMAIQHFRRGRINAGAVASEIADVEIMMSQLRRIFGTEYVDAAKADKLARLEGRMAQ